MRDEAAKAQGTPPPAAADQPLRGKVEEGKLTLVDPFGRSTESTTAGTEVKPGDTIVTKDEGASVALGDGSRMEVGPNARVILGAGPEPAVEQKVGRVFYDIKSRAESRRFNVNVVTPKGRYFIAVRGTQFTVDVAEDGSGTVLVTEGVVDVTSEGKTVAVQTGSSLAVRPGEVPSEPADVGGSSAPSVAVLPVLGVALLIAAGLGFVAYRLALDTLRRRRGAR